MAPMVIIGDEGFPLKTYFVRPYLGANLDGEKTIYNLKLYQTEIVKPMQYFEPAKGTQSI